VAAESHAVSHAVHGEVWRRKPEKNEMEAVAVGDELTEPGRQGAAGKHARVAAAGEDGHGPSAGSLWPWLRGEAPASARPVFSETLNQVGVGGDGWWLRRDVHDASDVAFWAGGNPNSGGGYWAPLGPGEHAVRLPVAAAAPPTEAPAALGRALEGYRRRALAARRHERGAPLELGPAQRDALRRLGYAHE